MELAKKLLSSVFPSRCLLCQKTVKPQTHSVHIEICSECFQRLPHNKVNCSHCALPLPDDLTNNILCGRCIKKPPAFDYAYSPLRYEDDVIRLMHQLKFGEKITYSRTFGEMLLQLLSQKLSQGDNQQGQNKPDCLLPVPLHRSRLRQRGFNQSIELARVISKKLNIPIEYDAVNRTRSTASQMGLDAVARKKNINGAFSVKWKLSDKLKDKHILIIDDVMTTGSTVNELAKTLKRSGVARVGVLSFARAPVKH